MHRFLAALPLVLLASCAGHPAIAADVAPAGATPVIIPWGEWTVAIVNSFVVPLAQVVLPVLAAWMATEIARRFSWATSIATQDRIEKMLTSILDYGVNSIEGAVKGKTLDAATGRAVLDVAARRAKDAADPAVVKAAGDLEEVVRRAFRKMDLGPDASAENVLEPVLAGLRHSRRSLAVTATEILGLLKEGGWGLSALLLAAVVYLFKALQACQAARIEDAKALSTLVAETKSANIALAAAMEGRQVEFEGLRSDVRSTSNDTGTQLRLLQAAVGELRNRIDDWPRRRS